MPLFATLATLAHIVTDSAVLNLAYAFNEYRYPAITEATHDEGTVWTAYIESMGIFDAACYAYAEELAALIPLHTQGYDFQESLHLCTVCVLPHAPSLHVASEYCEWSTPEDVLNSVYGIGFGA